MKAPKRILCIIDPTQDEQPALARAAMLATTFNAELRLYISWYYAYLTDIAADYGQVGASFSKAAIEGLQRRLDGLADNLRADGHTVTASAEWHQNLPDSIIAEAQRWRADLVVKETHYHTAIERALLTNTDWRLIRKCPLPLWLVKTDTSFGGRTRLLACVDPVREHDQPESLDLDILMTGKVLSDSLKAEFYAFHSFNPLVPVGHAATWALKPQELPIDEISARAKADHEAAFNALADKFRIAKERRVLTSGPVRTTLPGVIAELGISLVVLGAIARTKLKRAVIGSTAESVMDHVSCDLLVLRPG
ncbi:MAG: universal stress protein [Woeseiaceae bacterium]|nr:universal stress protein [Woeseiaceae bacterium]